MLTSIQQVSTLIKFIGFQESRVDAFLVHVTNYAGPHYS